MSKFDALVFYRGKRSKFASGKASEERGTGDDVDLLSCDVIHQQMVVAILFISHDLCLEYGRFDRLVWIAKKLHLV